MLEYLDLVKWDRMSGFLGSGDPPVYVRLLALNAFFLAIAGVRRAVAANPMTPGTMLLTQAIVLAANLFVLFQPEAMDYATTFIRRF